MASRRLLGKPLLDVGGRPLLRWVYDRAIQTKADRVMVVTPDREIGRYCEDYDLDWRATWDDCPTGTHRCALALSKLGDMPDLRVVVNWQCDEPLVEPGDVDRLIDLFESSPSMSIVTLMAPLTDSDWNSPDVTKVAVPKESWEPKWAYWFSRAPMRGAMLHCGVYAFRPSTLALLGKVKPTALSKAESLEQLAWIEKGYRIDCLEIGNLPLSINIEEDYHRFQEMVRKGEVEC